MSMPFRDTTSTRSHVTSPQRTPGYPAAHPLRAALAVLVVAVALLALTGGAPGVKAKAWLIMDEKTGVVVASSDPDQRRPMASTTKIMTGLLVLENVKDLSTKVSADRDARAVGESEIWIEPGEKLTVDQLMRGLMIASANDASLALADHVAGSEEKFVELMNKKAAELGLKNTHFTNPHGLDEAGHYSSARDLAILARSAMRDERFREYVRHYQDEIPWKGHPYPRLLTSHNTLLERFDWVDGIKTGWTDPAGYCIVISGEYGGRRFIVSLLGEPREELREVDGEKLYKYAARFYHRRGIAPAGLPAAHITVPYHEEGADLVTAGALVAQVRKGAPITAEFEAETEVELPLEEGTVLGEVVYTSDGVEVGRQDLVADRGYPEADWSTRWNSRLSGAWDWVSSLP